MVPKMVLTLSARCNGVILVAIFEMIVSLVVFILCICTLFKVVLTHRFLDYLHGYIDMAAYRYVFLKNENLKPCF